MSTSFLGGLCDGYDEQDVSPDLDDHEPEWEQSLPHGWTGRVPVVHSYLLERMLLRMRNRMASM